MCCYHRLLKEPIFPQQLCSASLRAPDTGDLGDEDDDEHEDEFLDFGI